VWGLEPLALGPEGDVTAARLGERAWGCVFHPEARPSDLAAKGVELNGFDDSVRQATLLRFLRELG
jgi:GMP synthase-like glutamine amidotransferase